MAIFQGPYKMCGVFGSPVLRPCFCAAESAAAGVGAVAQGGPAAAGADVHQDRAAVQHQGGRAPAGVHRRAVAAAGQQSETHHGGSLRTGSGI